ncbi:12265_t:CDS:2 [Funneliformis mosseae]|uniref:12265_t:CDS:1 n=1 Tax=Funneliformis mosseae TaxID=27381 RepID=A0A9N8VA11_FUNMO|nr:12265_t:CDS:2 [Funneliformis mosseae]
MLKNSLIRSSLIIHKPHFIQPLIVQPCRKSSPFSIRPAHSRTFSIFNLLRTIVGPLSFVSRSLSQPQKATQELESQALATYEKIKLPITHTFNRIPGFLGREHEIRILNDLLSGDPKFLIVNGSTRLCGKNLSATRGPIRRSISCDLHRFANPRSRFADLISFISEFASRLEIFFTRIASFYPNLKVFEDEAIALRSLRLSGPESYEKKQLLQNVQQSEGDDETDAYSVAKSQNRSDLAKLLEKFQAGLLMYHGVDLNEKGEEKKEDDEKDRYRIHEHDKDTRKKKIPIIVFDEAHKLRYLLNDNEALQILLDALVVFTVQDSLCHIIHVTSDAFYGRLLAQKLHTKSLIIGDLSRSEVNKYFHKTLVPTVPQEIREGIFKMEDDLHKVLGGRILYWKSFVQDYILSNGRLTIETFEPFIRAQHQLILLSKDLPMDDEIPGDPIKRISRYIIASPMNKVSYHRLCKEFTPPVIDELINDGILEYRLIDEIDDGNDDALSIEKPFVVPSSHLIKHAMEILLGEKSQIEKDV